MALEDVTKVDSVGIEKASGSVVLTIADSLDWTDEHAHLLALQAKLNAYFEFIERGQIWLQYPEAVGRPLIIDVLSRFPLPTTVGEFWKRACVAASQLKAQLRNTYYPGRAA